MEKTGPIWLYDGVCVLCSGAVQYVLKHEHDHTMRFVAIQSAAGRKLAQAHGIDPDNPDSFLFIDKGQALQKSDAVLALLAHVRGPAVALRVLTALPKAQRDWLYDRLARNRYALFGKHDVCLVPSPEVWERFALPEMPKP